jgi:hypothetical protein
MNKVEKLKAQMEKKLQQAEMEDRLEGELAKKLSIAPKMVHASDLWGSVASIYFGDEYARGNSGEHLPLSMADTLTVLAALPPVPLVEVRDSCLSHQPLFYRESLPENKRSGSESPICPVLVALEHGQGYGAFAKVQWWSTIAGESVSVSCVVRPLPKRLTYVCHRRGIKGGIVYDSPETSCTAFAPEDERGEPVANLRQRIVWAGGSADYPKRVSYTWDSIRDVSPLVEAEAILRALGKE